MYSLKENTRKNETVNLDSMTDEALLFEYRRSGDRMAFEVLMERYERELFNYLRHYLGNAEAAEDVFQTTFMQVHLKCEQFEEERRFRPWLFRIATNQAIDFKRRNRRFQSVSLDVTGESEFGVMPNFYASQLASNDLSPDDSAQKNERANQVREAIADLPDILKQTLYLVYFQGMKYREAAETLCVPSGTVKSRLCIAVKKLNEMLTELV